jgi:hypothetical protein
MFKLGYYDGKYGCYAEFPHSYDYMQGYNEGRLNTYYHDYYYNQLLCDYYYDDYEY